jgi:plastocyanin
MGVRQASLFLFLLLLAAPVAAGELSGRISARGTGVRDAVIFIEGVRAGTPPSRTVVIDQRRRTFIPHVAAIMVGTTVLFPNNDTVFHNVFSYREGKRFDLGLYPVRTTRRVQFDQPGLVKMYCNIHSNMSAFIWVVENPYFDVTDGKGNYRIAGIPAGSYRLRVWHERLGERLVTAQVPASGSETLNVALESK